MFQATKAGALYAIVVFSIGFILGTIRVLLLATRLGDDRRHRGSTHDARGELVRLPLVRGSARYQANGSGSIIVGLGRVPGAMSAEACMGAVFGRSLGDQLAGYGPPSGAIGLAAQVIFAMLPVIQVWRW